MLTMTCNATGAITIRATLPILDFDPTKPVETTVGIYECATREEAAAKVYELLGIDSSAAARGGA